MYHSFSSQLGTMLVYSETEYWFFISNQTTIKDPLLHWKSIYIIDIQIGEKNMPRIFSKDKCPIKVPWDQSHEEELPLGGIERSIV